MAKSPVDAKLEYIMSVFKHTELPRPDYKAIAAEMGQSSANNVQKKFKAIIESLGLKLIDNQIVDTKGGSGAKPATNGAASTPKSKKTTSAKSTPTAKNSPAVKKPTAIARTPAKKRKIQEDNESGDEHQQDTVVGAEVPVKEEDKGNDNVDEEVEVVSEGWVGGVRARSMTIKPDPMTADDEEDNSF